MNKLLTAVLGVAVTASTALGMTLATANVAVADDTTCETATAKVADLQADLDAKLGVAIDGVTYPNVAAVRSVLDALPDTVEPPAALVAIVDLAADLGVAIGVRDNVCDDDPPTTTPPPTSTVTTTPPPSDDEEDVDCDEVDASEAQEILDADRDDPHNLDADGDGIACEVDEVLDDDDDVTVNVDNDVVVPNGGVNTGGGPRA